MPPRRFEAAGADLRGYWGTPDATIDWCERDYVQSVLVAEFWNTVSNLVMLLVCVCALLQARRHSLGAVTQVHPLGWATVAAGSIAFHGTLRYQCQLLDELPPFAFAFAMLSLSSASAASFVSNGPLDFCTRLPPTYSFHVALHTTRPPLSVTSRGMQPAAAAAAAAG